MNIIQELNLLSSMLEAKAGADLKKITETMIAVGTVATAVDPEIALIQASRTSDPINDLIEEAMLVKRQADFERQLAAKIRAMSDSLTNLVKT